MEDGGREVPVTMGALKSPGPVGGEEVEGNPAEEKAKKEEIKSLISVLSWTDPKLFWDFLSTFMLKNSIIIFDPKWSFAVDQLEQ